MTPLPAGKDYTNFLRDPLRRGGRSGGHEVRGAKSTYHQRWHPPDLQSSLYQSVTLFEEVEEATLAVDGALRSRNDYLRGGGGSECKRWRATFVVALRLGRDFDATGPRKAGRRERKVKVCAVIVVECKFKIPWRALQSLE